MKNQKIFSGEKGFSTLLSSSKEFNFSKKSLFKPIIASSLALFLSNSLNAESVEIKGNFDDSCASNNTCSSITTNWININWNDTTGGNDYKATIDDTTWIAFKGGEDSGSTDTINFSDELFENGKIFASDNNKDNRSITVNLVGGKIFNFDIKNSKYEGDITVSDGGGYNSSAIGSKFNATFAHGMSGKITINRTDNLDNDKRTTFTFSGGDLGTADKQSTITIQRAFDLTNGGAVSYTHLTLPTKRIV